MSDIQSFRSQILGSLYTGLAASMDPNVQADRELSNQLIEQWIKTKDEQRALDNTERLIDLRNKMHEMKLDPNDPLDQFFADALRRQAVKLND